MRRSEIEAQNRYQVKRQNELRQAADIVADAWSKFDEVEAVAVIGSVAKRLWKEVPRFREYRRAGIEVWHECSDLDLALWVGSQHRLGALRAAAARALQEACNPSGGMSVASSQLDVFLFEPGSDRYLGRLCRFATCPKDKLDCLVPGCGAVPFNKRAQDFVPYDDILAEHGLLYQRGSGRLRSALDLPSVDSNG